MENKGFDRKVIYCFITQNNSKKISSPRVNVAFRIYFECTIYRC